MYIENFRHSGPLLQEAFGAVLLGHFARSHSCDTMEAFLAHPQGGAGVGEESSVVVFSKENWQ
jgi:hypothetical protein